MSRTSATILALTSRPRRLSLRAGTNHLFRAVGLVAAATVGSLVVDATITVAVLLLVLAVTVAATLGRAAGAVAALAGTAALSYYFTPPRHVFSLGKTDDALALVVFMVVAAIVSTLVDSFRSAEQAATAARTAEAEASARSAVESSRSAFFATAGHNLRTPLAGIRAAAEALTADPATLSAADATVLRTGILDEVDRLTALVSKVLQLSRATAGADVLELCADVDLGSLAQDVIERVRRAIPGPLIWHVEVAPLPAGMLVDPFVVEQILLSLAENAASHARSGSTVWVDGRETTGGYRLVVADDGPGVPPALRTTVFEPFRSDRGGARGGAGLGLAIVRGLAIGHGGTAQLLPGPGARFAVTLPGPDGRP